MENDGKKIWLKFGFWCNQGITFFYSSQNATGTFNLWLDGTIIKLFAFTKNNYQKCVFGVKRLMVIQKRAKFSLDLHCLVEIHDVGCFLSLKVPGTTLGYLSLWTPDMPGHFKCKKKKQVLFQQNKNVKNVRTNLSSPLTLTLLEACRASNKRGPWEGEDLKRFSTEDSSFVDVMLAKGGTMCKVASKKKNGVIIMCKLCEPNLWQHSTCENERN